jgi:hypothetical protein
MNPNEVMPEPIARWCQQQLGTPIEELFPPRNHLSQVIGVRLDDGREIVIKSRPDQPRIAACTDVQRHLAALGYPCPHVLAGPAAIGPLVATAETHVPGGEILTSGDRLAERYATALAELVRLAPAAETMRARLDPPPTWVWWDHDEVGIWAPRDDGPEDLNEFTAPPWLEQLARRVRDRLGRDTSRHVVGYADFEAQNLRFQGGRLLVVHNRDSLTVRRESMIVGAAAAVYTASGQSLSEATVEQTEAFLDAYEHARGAPLNQADRGACWAAGLWVRAYNAIKAHVDDQLGRDDAGAVLDRLAAEADERLNQAAA